MVRDWWVQAELKTHSQSAAGLNRLRISIHRVPTMIFDFPSDPTSPATYVFDSWNIIGSCWIIHHYVWYTQIKFYLVSLTTWYDAPTQVTIPLQIIFSALWDEEQLWLQNRLGGTKSILKWKKLVSKLSDYLINNQPTSTSHPDGQALCQPKQLPGNQLLGPSKKCWSLHQGDGGLVATGWVYWDPSSVISCHTMLCHIKVFRLVHLVCIL